MGNAVTVTTTDPCRFCRLYARFLVAFGVLVGAVASLQWGMCPDCEGGAAVRSLVFVDNVVARAAPAAAGSALTLALAMWSHGLGVAELQREWPRIWRRAAMVTPLGFVASVLIALLIGFGVGRGVYAESWSTMREGLALFTQNLGEGAYFSAIDTGLVLFLAWRLLPRLSALPASLATKLVLAWTVASPLRVTVAFIAADLLPR